MASYKVPQDVEAEDKLIGPFSFRQFIYVIIAVVSAFAAYFFFKIFPILVVLPLPFVLFFGILALPLRKDQSMEVYLAAIVRFILKPRMRLWDPEGTMSMVTITVPHTQEVNLTKEITSHEARQRLGYLARVVDTGGWSTRGVTSGVVNDSNLEETYAAEATTAPDVMDTQAPLSQSFGSLISKADTSRHRQIATQFAQGTLTASAPIIAAQPAVAVYQPAPPAQQSYPKASPVVQPQPAAAFVSLPAVEPSPNTLPTYNPYPTNMHQRVISPAGNPQPATATSTSGMPETVSPDIMRLASNNDLSISAIAREAHRLEEKEIVVPLR